MSFIYAYTMIGFGTDKDKIQKGKRNNVYNTETMLPVSEIRGNTLILKDGGLRAIIKVTGVNVDLKNLDEQEAVVEQYKRFLNGMEFPIQILLRNTYLELSDYILYMRDNVNKVKAPALKDQGEKYVNFLEQINAQQGLIYVKEFYIVIPYYNAEADKENIGKSRWSKFLEALSKVETPEKIVQRYRGFISNNKFLDTRVNVIIEGLRGVGMYGERLELPDIISLLFKVYNPDAHKNQAAMSE